MEKIVLIDDVLCSLFSMIVGSNEVYVRDIESGFLKHTITADEPIRSQKEAAQFIDTILVSERRNSSATNAAA